jgi:hypothetical protein
MRRWDEGVIMDPKVLLLLPGLAACPTMHTHATLHSLTNPATPVHEWPVRQEQPEKTDPPHGEGSGESVIFVGINTNVATNTSGSVINVDSGASGSHSMPSATWLPNGLDLITSINELSDPFPPAMLPGTMIPIGPERTKHLTNPSTIKSRRSYTRRRG